MEAIDSPMDEQRHGGASGERGMVREGICRRRRRRVETIFSAFRSFLPSLVPFGVHFAFSESNIEYNICRLTDDMY